MSDRDGPLFLVVTIKPRLDRREEAEAQLQSMRRHSLEEPGCVFMHLVAPHDDPETWIMLEMFRSRAAWDEHVRQPYNTEGKQDPRGPASRAVGSAPVRRKVGAARGTAGAMGYTRHAARRGAGDRARLAAGPARVRAVAAAPGAAAGIRVVRRGFAVDRTFFNQTDEAKAIFADFPSTAAL